MTNYKILFSLKLLKSIVSIFIRSFFVMYFLKLSSENVLSLGIYYIIVYVLVYLTMFALKYKCKERKRVNLLRIGIALNLLYFLMIIVLKERTVDFIYLMALLYGLEEGFYYSVYTNFESSGVTNKQRTKYFGFQKALTNLVGVFIPIIFGSIIDETGFQKATIILVIIVIIMFILTYFFKDINKEIKTKPDLKGFQNLIYSNKELKEIFQIIFLNSFLYTGAFKNIMLLYLIIVLSTSLDLGIFSSLVFIITAFISYLFAKKIPKNKYELLLKLSFCFFIFSIIIIMFKVNFVTVVLFNLLQILPMTIYMLLIEINSLNISNNQEIKEKYKVEYFLYNEKTLFKGRLISYLLFIIIGISSSMFITNTVLIAFSIIALLLTYKLIKITRD